MELNHIEKIRVFSRGIIFFKNLDEVLSFNMNFEKTQKIVYMMTYVVPFKK